MKKCVKCGRDIPDEANFCPYCETLQVEKKIAETPRVINRKPLYTTAAIVLVLIIAALMWIMTRPANETLPADTGQPAGSADQATTERPPVNTEQPPSSKAQPSPRTGLYESAEDGMPAGGFIGMVKDGNDGPWVYNIEYASGPDFKGRTLYYYDSHYKFSPDYSIDTGYKEVSVTRVNESMVMIEFGPGCTGGYRIDFELGENNFPLFFIDTN